jgi:hypothetical protein
MPAASSDDLKELTGLIRQLRGIAGLREKSPGLFTLNGQPFVQFQNTGEAIVAELRAGAHKTGGFERFAVGSATEQRKLVDEAKRRADKLAEE